MIYVLYVGWINEVAGEIAFSYWSVSVINDEDFSVRAMFEAWSNALNRLVSNVRDPAISAEQYKVDFDIVQYGKDGSTLRSYQLIGAFPTQIGGIALSWESASAIEEFTVNFAYDYWIPLVESSDKKAGGVNVYGGLAQQDGVNGPA